jgi:hypothetical protein
MSNVTKTALGLGVAAAAVGGVIALAAGSGDENTSSGDENTSSGDENTSSCENTIDTEYIISGGPDPDAVIFVDDVLRVFVNANLVAEGWQGSRLSPPVPPIRFVANTGDILRLQAQDVYIGCYHLDTLWLQKFDGRCLTQLTGDIPGRCGEPPGRIFFDQTFTLP